MDEPSLRKSLAGLPIGGLRYFDRTGSTNDEAFAWAASGAPDLALVIADTQTAGRGRGSRRWYTPPEAAIALSLIIRPKSHETQETPFFSALGALAVCEALAERGFAPEIKWPNDVLLNRRKVGGVLAESIWTGTRLDNIVIGIGMNVGHAAIPPDEQLNFPATSLEDERSSSKSTSESLDRLSLLRQILQAALYWRNLITSPIFLRSWENRLAFRGEQVQVWIEGQPTRQGEIMGLERDGSLRLSSQKGWDFSVQFGEVHLRPVV